MSDNENDTLSRVNGEGPVGVIGLGVMGHAIATRLQRELGALTVHDLRRDVANDLVGAGATFCNTAAGVAADCDIVVLSLNTAPIVEQVVFDGGGVLAGWNGAHTGLIIDMSSIAPDCTREFAARVAERGFSWVDAPLSGGVPGALAGRLSIMIGGDTHAVARAETVLDHLAARVTRRRRQWRRPAGEAHQPSSRWDRVQRARGSCGDDAGRSPGPARRAFLADRRASRFGAVSGVLHQVRLNRSDAHGKHRQHGEGSWNRHRRSAFRGARAAIDRARPRPEPRVGRPRLRSRRQRQPDAAVWACRPALIPDHPMSDT